MTRWMKRRAGAPESGTTGIPGSYALASPKASPPTPLGQGNSEEMKPKLIVSMLEIYKMKTTNLKLCDTSENL